MAYPDYYEEEGTRELTFNRRGAFGKRIFVAKWEHRFLDPSGDIVAPLLGDPYPGYANLKCSEITYTPMGKTGDGATYTGVGRTPTGTEYFTDTADYSHCRITAIYEVEYLSGWESLASGDCTTDVLNIGQGRLWVIGQRPVEDVTAVLIPTIAYGLKLVMTSVPLTTIFDYTGKVNADAWEGAAIGTMLYEGATWDEDYDMQTGAHRYIVTHRFRWRANSWNQYWRPARQKRDENDNPIVDVNGYPVYEDGVMGFSAWDTMDPPLYESIAFSGTFA
jgi:hypothetical protein